MGMGEETVIFFMSLRVLAGQMGQEPSLPGSCREYVRKRLSNTYHRADTECTPTPDARSSVWLWEPFAF